MYTDLPNLRSLITPVPDFPEPGVLFQDISPLLADIEAMDTTLDLMANRLKGQHIDVVLGVDARGFVLGGMLARHLRKGFGMVRKSAKQPPPKIEQSYSLEYGQATLAIREGLIQPGQIVLVVDDVLATGGTLEATCQLIRRQGGIPLCLVLIEIVALQGRAKLQDETVVSILLY